MESDFAKKINESKTPSEAGATVETTLAKETKTIDKTVWDWDLMNESKPIWQRK